MNDMLVHTDPTVEELRGLFRYLQVEKAWGFVGDDLRIEADFIRFFQRSDVAPMVFEWDGQCIGILWLTSYEPFPKSAFLHYAVAPRHGRPLIQAARAFLDAVLDGPDYDLLFATWETKDAASRKLAQWFGFEIFAERNGSVFAMRGA